VKALHGGRGLTLQAGAVLFNTLAATDVYIRRSGVLCVRQRRIYTSFNRSILWVAGHRRICKYGYGGWHAGCLIAVSRRHPIPACAVDRRPCRLYWPAKCTTLYLIVERVAVIVCAVRS